MKFIAVSPFKRLVAKIHGFFFFFFPYSEEFHLHPLNLQQRLKGESTTKDRFRIQLILSSNAPTVILHLKLQKENPLSCLKQVLLNGRLDSVNEQELLRGHSRLGLKLGNK